MKLSWPSNMRMVSLYLSFGKESIKNYIMFRQDTTDISKLVSFFI